MKVVFLNALPLNAFPFSSFMLRTFKVTVDELKTIIAGKQIINYIRHPATISLLSSLLGINLTPNPGIYQYSQGDEIVVITLKTPQRGQEVQTISPSDLLIYRVEVI
jgi:hypothetical protein